MKNEDCLADFARAASAATAEKDKSRFFQSAIYNLQSAIKRRLG